MQTFEFTLPGNDKPTQFTLMSEYKTQQSLGDAMKSIITHAIKVQDEMRKALPPVNPEIRKMLDATLGRA